MTKNEKTVAALAGLAAVLVAADKALANLQTKLERDILNAEIVTPTDVQP